MNKLIGVVLLILFFMNGTKAQKDMDSIKTALLIIDIQEFYFPGEGPGLVNAEPASLVAKEVLHTFRENELLVIHVRHQSNSGMEIHKNVTPLPSEKIISKNEINSYHDTDLLEYLKQHKITRLVLMGMQTQMCLEAAVRASYDYGFGCIVIQDACATRDLTFEGKTIKAEDVHASTLATLTGGGYAKVINMNTFKDNMEMYLHQELK